MSENYNLLRVLDYIEENIKSDLSLYDIASQAGYSVPHFYRLFRRLTGDTIGEYIERQKIVAAAKELKISKKSITNIAYEYGFNSHDVFTRTFTRVFGVTPSRYRHSDMDIPPLKRLTITENYMHTDGKSMTFKVIDMKRFCVIGIECSALKWDDDGTIGRLWDVFLRRAEEINKADDSITMYGICENQTLDNGRFKYIAAIKTQVEAEVPCGMIKKIIEPRKFLMADVPDSISLPDAYTSTINYAKSLGYEIDEADDFEVYEDSFHDPDFNRVKILIPIK